MINNKRVRFVDVLISPAGIVVGIVGIIFGMSVGGILGVASFLIITFGSLGVAYAVSKDN